MKINIPVTDVAYNLAEHDSIVSKTDLRGMITYINEDFLRVSGFSKQELIGKPHNIVRHPDMPPEAFEDMWQSLKAGRPWMGIVKNRAKTAAIIGLLPMPRPFTKTIIWSAICRCAVNPFMSKSKRQAPPTNDSAKAMRTIWKSGMAKS